MSCRFKKMVALAILLILFAINSSYAETVPVLRHRAEIDFNIQNNSILVTDNLSVPAELVYLRLGPDFEIQSIISPDGSPVDLQQAVVVSQDEDGSYQQILVKFLNLGKGSGRITLTYGGVFNESVKDVVFSRENVGNEISATISDEGIYMSAACEWLAGGPEAMATFDLSFTTPDGFETVTQGSRTVHQVNGNKLQTRWVTDQISDGLTVIANKYFIHETTVREGLTSYTFFLDDDQRLRDLYHERTAAYLKMYEDMLGPYPYSKFATVENWFPTGYGMPSYTLLGGQVLRLPFIPYTSLGHEICHNWWGNSVFVDSDQGNWCEGITVYCADYHYKALESPEAAREYRRTLLKDYAAYVKDPAKDFPLVDFVSRHSGATRAVGYGKSMMVFHMLEREIGSEAFGQGLRQVVADFSSHKVSWDDFFAAFSKASGQDLTKFRTQWLTRKGAPQLVLTDVEFKEDKVSFKLVQGAPPYSLQVPVVVTVNGKNEEKVVHFNKMSQRFELAGQDIDQIAIDPDDHLFRQLPNAEIEPTLSQVLADDAPSIILTNASERMIAAAHVMGSEMSEVELYAVMEDGQIPADYDPGTGHSNVAVNPGAELLALLKRPELTISGKTVILDGKRYSLNKYDLVYAVTDPHDPSMTDLVVMCSSPARLESLSRRIGHYGKYSWLALPIGMGSVDRGNWEPVGSPLVQSKK